MVGNAGRGRTIIPSRDEAIQRIQAGYLAGDRKETA